MHTHRLDSYLIAPNVKLEIVHENNPFFTGECISLAIRLKHLGSLQEFDSLNHNIFTLNRQINERLNKDDERKRNDGDDDVDENANGIDSAASHTNTTMDKPIAESTIAGAWSMKSLWNNVFKKGNEDQDSMNNDNNNFNEPAATEDDQIQLNEWKKQLQFHNPVNLMAGFIQIVGVCQYNSELINESALTIKGKKIVGMINHRSIHNKQDITNSDMDEFGLLTSKYLDSNFESVMNLNKQLNIAPNSNLNNSNLKQIIGDNDENYNEVPICVIPQSLLFSEIQLRPGEMKVYQFKSDCLPKDLCPSYSIVSKNINIQYLLEFGTNITNGTGILPYKLKVPITVAPFINSNSEQVLVNLDKESYISNPATIKDISVHSRRLESSISMQLRKKSVSSINSAQQKLDNERHSSLKKSFKKILIENLKEDTKNKDNHNVDNNTSENFDIDYLVEYQLSKQFDESIDLNTVNNNRDTFANDDLPIDVSTRSLKSQKSVKDVINDLRTFVPTDTVSSTNETKEREERMNDDTTESNNDKDTHSENSKQVEVGTSAENPLIQQLTTNIRQDYVINRNGQLLAKVKFSQLFYTTLDNIDMVIYAQESNDYIISGIKVSLQRAELFNKKYLIDHATARPYYWTICHAECTTFDIAQAVPLKLVTPKSPMNQIPSQFKSDIFELKWILHFQFILVKRSKNTSDNDLPDGNQSFIMSKHYEDKTGSIYNSKRTLEGEEFAFRMPIAILPPDLDLGGW